MPLDSSVLAGLIKTNIQASFLTLDETELQKLADAIAEAVVNHITGAAVVTVNGVTAGGASATGTIA